MANTRSPAGTRAGRPAGAVRRQRTDSGFMRRHRKAVTALGAGLAAALFFFAGVGVAAMVITERLKSNIGKLAAGFPSDGALPPGGQDGLPFGPPASGEADQDLSGWAKDQSLPDGLPDQILGMLHQQYPDGVPAEVKDKLEQQFGG